MERMFSYNFIVLKELRLLESFMISYDFIILRELKLLKFFVRHCVKKVKGE